MNDTMEEEEHGAEPNSLQSIQMNYKEVPKTDKISIKFSPDKSERLLAANAAPLKPESGEAQAASSREALSYLKAKRIIKHKGLPDSPDSKKFKPSE